jgi:hypothetical protein
MPRSFVTACIAVGLAASGGCSIDVRGEEIVVREEKRFTVTAPLELALMTYDGAIEVRSWDRNEVLVEIERRAASTADAQALEVVTSQQGQRVTVEARGPSGNNRPGGDVVHLGSWRSPSVSFVVTVPRQVSLEARTGDGSIVARDLAGTVVLRSGDGAIRVERVGGDLRVDTADGAVTVRDLHGTLDLNTGDGSVDVSGRLEIARVHTGDGAVRLEAMTGSAMKSEWSIDTGDGAIALVVPPDFNAQLDAYSGDGRITASGIGNATPSEDNDQPARLNAALGSGGSVLRLRTGDGPITVTR